MYEGQNGHISPDGHHQCIKWKNKGYCKGTYASYMAKNCEESCGLCTPKGKSVLNWISDPFENGATYNRFLNTADKNIEFLSLIPQCGDNFPA